jgi:hypothetical protein
MLLVRFVGIHLLTVDWVVWGCMEWDWDWDEMEEGVRIRKDRSWLWNIEK